MQVELDVRRRRALFRASHRGTKEMDWMLGKYADASLATMAEGDLDLFEKLILAPDPDLQAWILDPALIAGSEFGPLIAAIRTFNKLDQPAA